MNDLAQTVLGSSRGRSAPESAPGHRPTFESCVERLATAIRLGVYPYGDALPPERELAGLLGVSRATVREAIAALRTAGMVRTTRGRGGGTVGDLEPPTPGDGSSVAGTDPATPGPASRRPELLDALVFRRVVEPGACAVAATGDRSAADLDALRAAHDQVRDARTPAEHRQADSRLHLAIAATTGSAYLVDAVTQVQAAVHEMLVAIPVLPVNIEHSNVQHAEVVAAIEAREPDRARRAMEEHCDDTAALLRGLLL